MAASAVMFVRRVAVGGLLIVALGVPILETWEALLGAAAMLMIAFSESTAPWRRIGLAAATVVAVVALKAALPRADLAEAHNPFLVIQDAEPLQQGLPPAVFRSWKAQFDALYPPDTREPTVGTWRYAGVPTTLFTRSADAAWRTPKFSRQVDRIDFRSLGDFRGGFANDDRYGFWTGELQRESMPFYVMYELTPASVGSRLEWKGRVFWEREAGRFEEVVHELPGERTIVPGDAGKRVYAAFFPKDTEPLFRFRPSPALRLSAWAEGLMTLAGAAGLLALTIRPRWPAYLRVLTLFSAAYLLIAAFIGVSAGKYLGKSYPPQGGGDDGLFHDGLGHLMALMAADGDVVGALEGNEPVYWFTPGTRYLRMVEKLIFGDTNHLFALLVACVPLVVFYLFRHFLGTRRAWLLTGLFLALPAGNLSFLHYIANAKLGYGDAIATAAFLLGLVLLLRTQPGWGGTRGNAGIVWTGGAALAASMFLRPNFAFAVVWLGLAHAWAAWRRRDVVSLTALTAGLGLALWMPLHNWYYGGEFYLISRSGATVSVPLGIGDYVQALAAVLQQEHDSAALATATAQLSGWLWAPGFVVREIFLPLAWIVHAAALLGLAIGCWVAAGALRGRHWDSGLAVVAIAAICAHIPMLFIFSTHYRYAMLGWDLSLVVVIVWAAQTMAPRPASRTDVLPV